MAIRRLDQAAEAFARVRIPDDGPSFAARTATMSHDAYRRRGTAPMRAEVIRRHAPVIPGGGNDLADALVAGEDEAFTMLVELETDHVFRVCHRVLGDITEAEEAVQDTFVQAYRALATYRGDGPPRAWLSRIAVREAWRRGSARTKQRDVTSPLEDAIAAGFRDEADVQREVIANEEREALRAAVARLHSPYQEVILDRYFANLTLKEIAAATGRPLGTVKVQIHRGLAHLRRLMEQDA